MPTTIQLGLKENAKQFALLLLINAFVGGMVGMERSIFPQYAEQQFGITAHTALLSFILIFGLAKATANYFTGKLANTWGRKNLLLVGWLLAIPVPILLLYAPTWNWVLAANLLLGLSQGLTWSSTVVMKMDLVGEKDRGFAMGLNEFAGYLSVGLIAFLTGYLANTYGILPYPFYLGIALALAGLLLTAFGVKDTRHHVAKEMLSESVPALKQVFWDTTFRNKTLSSVTQAGLINNLNDGMMWGLLPIYLLNLPTVASGSHALLIAIYPSIWGIGQLFTGKLADLYSKKKLLVGGMLLQGLAILGIPVATHFSELAMLSVSLGLGTALVYPTFLATIAQTTPADQRAESMGTFRLWRDLGYPAGALISGITADQFGLPYAIGLVGLLTLGSAWIIQARMPKN